MGSGKLVIIRDSAVKVQLALERPAQVEPSCHWKVQAAGILELFVVVPGGFGILLFQMQLAKLDGGVLMASRVSLSPVKLLEQHEGVGRVSFSGQVFLKLSDGLLRFALVDGFGRVNDGRIRRPAHLLLNRRAHLVFKSRARKNERAHHTESESTNVGPMSDAGRLARHGTIEYFHQTPEGQEPNGR